MKKNSKYSIGDASKLCNISTKALRHYDKIGLIKPLRSSCNNYRFYDDDSLRRIPIIKYYKQMGFTLEEMAQLITGEIEDTYKVMQEVFKDKMAEVHKAQKGLEIKYNSVHDWYDLVQEAKSVLENQNTEVSIQLFPSADYLLLKQNFNNDICAAVINIEFTDYVEKMKTNVAGPVILHFDSHKERIDHPKSTSILQKIISPCLPESSIFIGAQSMARCYHIGSHSTIKNTYEKITAWAELNNYALADECYERYVIDYWTTHDCDKYVTEVMIPATRNISL